MPDPRLLEERTLAPEPDGVQGCKPADHAVDVGRRPQLRLVHGILQARVRNLLEDESAHAADGIDGRAERRGRVPCEAGIDLRVDCELADVRCDEPDPVRPSRVGIANTRIAESREGVTNGDHVMVGRLDFHHDVAVEMVPTQPIAKESRGAPRSPRRQLAHDAVTGQASQRLGGADRGVQGGREERGVQWTRRYQAPRARRRRQHPAVHERREVSLKQRGVQGGIRIRVGVSVLRSCAKDTI